jgi:hypothetical protein
VQRESNALGEVSVGGKASGGPPPSSGAPSGGGHGGGGGGGGDMNAMLQMAFAKKAGAKLASNAREAGGRGAAAAAQVGLPNTFICLFLSLVFKRPFDINNS